MRVQIYQEELGEGVELVKKVTENDGTFYGLRVWLKTCQPLLEHSTPEDDDRSAVTFWARTQADLQILIRQMQNAWDVYMDY